MRFLLSTKYNNGAFNTAMLLLRVGLGILMMVHGYDKLINFGAKHASFGGYLGMSSTLSMALVVFAEFFCSLFVIIGLFTRLSTIPLIICMLVALFTAHNGSVFGKGEPATLYLLGYFTLLLVGPGKISVDNLTGK
jgi:putative oxidoreductase